MPGRVLHVLTQGSSQLEQVLPAMLQGGHLAAEERLACFQSSKGMAELVLRHWACTHLTLKPPPPAAGGSNSRSNRSARAHAAAAQQLAALSHSVTLTLHGRVLTPSACLLQRVTTLRLHDMQVDQTTSSRLQLHKLPRLHTLSLQRCRMTASSRRQPNPQHRNTSVRTLECMAHANTLFPGLALELVEPSQLQTLVTDSTISSVTSLLPQLPALQELRISAGGRHGHVVRDDHLENLLAHPGLALVTVPTVYLRRSHANTPCTWDSLHLLQGVELSHVALLPMAGIGSCTVHGFSTMDEVVGTDKYDDLVAALGRAQHFMFQADGRNTGGDWTPAEPTFQLIRYDDDPLEEGHNPGLTAQVITLIMRHLTPGTALLLAGFAAIRVPEVLASLAAAPATLTTLGVTDYLYDATVDGGFGAVPGIVAHVPAHVSHVVLHMSGDTSRKRWLELLQLFIAGVQRPLQLTLVVYFPEDEFRAWEEHEKAVLHEWLATHASQHVHVEFQSCIW